MIFQLRSAGRLLLPAAVSLLLSPLLLSSPVAADNVIEIGSSNAATVEPPVSRPETRPIAVPLFHDLTFTDYASHPFSYTPPAGNTEHGKTKRWARIVLVADFYVTAGRQYDRTGEMSIGHTNVYFGTTAEPSDHVSPTWHVERDVTDDTALLQSAQPGQIQIGNTVNSTYTGVIHGTASLLFYPLARHEAPPAVPDLVLPLPLGKNGQTSLNSPTDALSQSYTFPTNTVRVYLDLVTESQGSDEFWYLSAPTDPAAKVHGGDTAFREAEVTVDGVPAGVAPVFPWIYTGGIDPGWWRPIPAVQTLDFVPYRVDLTPFAGQFSNGKPHTIGVRVFNNANFFQVAGTLRVYRDPKFQVVHGGLTQDTLTAPAPVVQNHLTGTKDVPLGSVSVTSSRRFTIAGTVLTSAGKVKTTITQTVGFSNTQQYTTASARSLPAVHQLSTVSSVTQTQTPGMVVIRQDTFQYPLLFSSVRQTRSDGSTSRTTAVQQGSVTSHQTRRDGRLVSWSRVSDLVTPSDTQSTDTAGKPQKRKQHSVQTYAYAGPQGSYTTTITADNGVVTRVTDSRLPHGK